MTVLLMWAIHTQAATNQKGTLVVALDTLGAQTMDPIIEGRAPQAHYQAPVFDCVVWFDPVKGSIGPGAAERWEMAGDGQSWIFYIRKGQRWHNGDPVTAHDVKFSLERIISPESLAGRAAGMRRDIERIEVQDDYTVRIYTNGTLPYFVEGLSRAVFQEGQIMPKKYIETVGVEEFRKKPMGSGPWKFVRSVPGDRLEDVSIRAQIMNLLKRLQQQYQVSYLLVAHNLATVRYMAHQTAVMYLGQIVEHAATEALYSNPLHPYTKALFSAALPAHPDMQREEIVLPGEVPSPINPPSGCHFHPRCPFVKPECSEVEPIIKEVAPNHKVSCHLYP
jgi:oligopeptide/dipeptide ABC transporter ATP-binding protein